MVSTTNSVGIGTSSPSEPLYVVGNSRSTGDVLAQYGDTTTPSFRFGTGTESSGISSPVFESVSILTDGAERLRVHSTGGVSIGTTADSGALNVAGAGGGTGGAVIRAENTSQGSGIAFNGVTHGTDATMVLTQQGPADIIRAFNGGCCSVFTVTNTGRVVTTALQITGGGDLVEGFETSALALEPGTVVVIDPENAGGLIESGAAYDSRVAGVVSGANGVEHGIRMGQQDVLDGDTLLAMAGRVYVKCSTENGAIRPGDLLTTAGLAGHAMKVTAPDRAFGAVIGKAMSALDDGTGLVLVLVNLQ